MINRKDIFLILNSISIIFFITAPIYSGIIIEQIEGSTNFRGTIKTVLYFSENSMRTDDLENGITNIYRFSDDYGYFISHKKKSYIKYKLSERADDLSKITQINKEKNSKKDRTFADRKLSITKTNEIKTINGFNVFKVKIMTDNELIEENWLTNDIDMNEVKNTIDIMKKQYKLQNTVDSEEYRITQKLEKMGFLILSKRYSVFLGEKVEDFTEVKKIIKKDLNDSIFLPPKGYKELKKK